jgi:acetyl esterase/lipase
VTASREELASPPAADPTSALLAAASHPDPWFAAVAAAQLAAQGRRRGGDPELVSRLEAQATTGSYVPPAALTEDLDLPGPHGPVRVRVYRPGAAGAARPLLVWCHGGGFLGGDLDMPEADATARELAARAGAVVLSVDYRLAVQGVHYPVPLDDVHAAYVWAVEHADQLGAGTAAVIGGGSAGANLAAGVAVRLRDEGAPPAGVMLLYPIGHPVLPPASPELAAKLDRLSSAHTFTAEAVKPVVENYLGAPDSEASPYAMAGIADLQGYPPTLIINCEYDGLRASGEAFAAALEAVGTPVTQLLAPDVLHGHINSPWLPQAQQSYADMAQWLAQSTEQRRPR